jgi:hypothetical protein
MNPLVRIVWTAFPPARAIALIVRRGHGRPAVPSAVTLRANSRRRREDMESAPMTDIILHHYDTSPYAEKVRTGLGLKGLAWASVELPVIMPKPNLTALTGGYRKTPVLQIGADIYCDSQLIMRELA